MGVDEIDIEVNFGGVERGKFELEWIVIMVINGGNVFNE